jgi:ribosomal protein L40E
MTDAKKDENKTARQRLIAAWSGAAGGIIFWSLLATFLFGWDTWWIYFLLIITAAGPIKATINYFSVETKKCAVCGSRLDQNAGFCRTCGNKVFTGCPSCGAPLNPSAQFCEKCGKKLYETKTSPPVMENVVTTNVQQQTQTTETIFCYRCGNKLPSDAKICDLCGAEM